MGLEGEAEAEHVLEEDVGDGAVELVLVVAVVVADDQVEPIRLAGRPEGDFGVEVGRDISFEEGGHGGGDHQPPVPRVIAEPRVEVALVLVHHLEREIIVDRSDSETGGELCRQLSGEGMRVGGECAVDTSGQGSVVAVGPVFQPEQDVVHDPVRSGLEGMVDVDAGHVEVALEGIGRLVHLPDGQLGVGEKQVPILSSYILQRIEFQADLIGQVVGVPVRAGVEREACRDIVLLEDAQHGFGALRREGGRTQAGQQGQEKPAIQLHRTLISPT